MTLKRLLDSLIRALRRSNLPKQAQRDLMLGVTPSRDRQQFVLLPESARPMHLGIMGLTGVGKTYFLESLIRQDIDQGTGFAVFDVHGDLADQLVAELAERGHSNPELLDRVVLVEPFDPDYTVGFNPLERTPETSPFVQAQELAGILRTRWEAYSFSPRTEELLRSALYTLSAHNLTLLELPALLTNKVFRSSLTKALDQPAIVAFWRGRYDLLSDPMKAVVREPLLTRISAFLADPQVREIIGQRKSTFSFRGAIAKGLWVIVNLSKGKLGGENSAVLGSLLFTKLHFDVMAQARVAESDRKLFAVYADELQNLAGHSFATLIAEARKYCVALTASHQFWRQLPPDLRAAMLAVGSRVLFRLTYQDARELAGELDPIHKQAYIQLLTTLGQGQAVFRGGPHPPIRFTVRAHKSPKPAPASVQLLRERSRALYAARRADIRRDIDERYHQSPRTTTGQLLLRPSSHVYHANTSTQSIPTPPAPPQ